MAKVEFEVVKIKTIVSTSGLLLHDSEFKFVILAELSFGRVFADLVGVIDM